MQVVFTGPAEDHEGVVVLRADLAELAQARGYVVENQVTPRTRLLVASRFDTVKAREAKARGILVTSYADFIASLGGAPPKSGRFNSFVDQMPPREEDWADEL